MRCSVGVGSNVQVVQRVGLGLFNALIDYDSDKFDSAVEHLLPVKYEITDGLLNGSRAQVRSCVCVVCQNIPYSVPCLRSDTLFRTL